MFVFTISYTLFFVILNFSHHAMCWLFQSMDSGRRGRRGQRVAQTVNTTGAACVRTLHRQMAADTAREMT